MLKRQIITNKTQAERIKKRDQESWQPAWHLDNNEESQSSQNYEVLNIQ